MKEDNERVEALNAIFDDDPIAKEREKERQKEIRKLEKKKQKMLAKREKKQEHSPDTEEEPAGTDDDIQVRPENVDTADTSQENGMKKNYFAETEDSQTEQTNQQASSEPKKKRKKRKEKEKEEINIVKDLISLAIYILAIVAVCWLILTYVGQRTEVSGDSMNDTLHNGDSLWVDKLSYHFTNPERFDIVIFPYEDGTYYIKRIIGLPGETVYIDEDGVIYIDGEPLSEDYGKETIAEEHRGLAAEPITLGDDEYFVMGDNRNNSRDSRLSDVGNIKRDSFVGKAVFRFTGGFGFLNKDEE